VAETQTDSIALPAFSLRTADMDLEGQVVDADDKPASGAQVNIGGQSQPSANIVSDSTGHFTFKVCAGAVTVNAYKQPNGNGQFLQGNAQARGGDLNVVVKLGVNQRPANPTGQAPPRTTPLKPAPWTWTALSQWPSEHKTAMLGLLGAQLVFLVGAIGGIFWFTRLRGS
jgi:hypothetical protein